MNIDQIKLQASVNAIIAQRDAALSEIVSLHGEIAALRAQLQEAAKKDEIQAEVAVA